MFWCACWAYWGLHLERGAQGLRAAGDRLFAGVADEAQRAPRDDPVQGRHLRVVEVDLHNRRGKPARCGTVLYDSPSGPDPPERCMCSCRTVGEAYISEGIAVLS